MDDRELGEFMGAVKTTLESIKHDTNNLRTVVSGVYEQARMTNGNIIRLDTRLTEHEKLEGHPGTIKEVNNIKNTLKFGAGAIASVLTVAGLVAKFV